MSLKDLDNVHYWVVLENGVTIIMLFLKTISDFGNNNRHTFVAIQMSGKFRSKLYGFLLSAKEYV